MKFHSTKSSGSPTELVSLLLQNAGLGKQAMQAWLGLGRTIQGSHKSLPLVPGQREAALVSKEIQAPQVNA
jgi:hypothetical protein